MNKIVLVLTFVFLAELVMTVKVQASNSAISEPCTQKSYGRGAGYPWRFGDGFNDKGMFARCQKDNGAGNCEKFGAVVYPKCKTGFVPSGCCICISTNPNC